MKNIYILLTACALFAQFATAQSSTQRDADKLFAQHAFYEAAALYEEQEKTQEVLQNLADSYYYFGESQKAYDIYTQLFENFEKLDEGYHRRYADAAKGVGDYAKADELILKITGEPVDTKAHFAKLRESNPHRFDVEMLDPLSGDSGFGIAFNDRQVVFASTRNVERPIYAWNGKPFLDLYYAKVSGTTFTDVGLFPGDVNTDAHESNAAFHPNGTTMYFTRNSDKKVRVGRERVGVLKIYQTELIDGQWTDVQTVSFAGEKFDTAHPSVNRDGSKMYFSSNMDGGFGSYDIYQVDINADGTFGEPRNLGDAVNTDGREQFPFISARGDLYFASTGGMTLGGLDIFKSDGKDGAFAKAYNLGTTINGQKDDFAFVLDERSRSGFYSSNRSGEDKMFSYTRRKNTDEEYIVGGVVRDKNSNALLPGSLVTLFDEGGNVIQDTIVKADAKYIFDTKPNRRYRVRGTRKLYIPYDTEFETDQDGNISKNIYLELESYADTEDKINRDSITNIVQVKLDKIFFDYDKSNIKPAAAKTLDELVALMEKYPEMEIEVAAHTDAYGDADYNLALSKRRAQSTMDYLISRGIAAGRLKPIGYGEMQPLNSCTEEGVCSREKYDINRRCEFTVLN